MKLERLISMIYMLLNNEIISASELADKYKVSQRTIYRDIEAICAAGIPVVSYQGVNGGYGIIEEYKMDKSLLGSYDVGSLITLLQSMSTVFKDEKAMETVRRLQTIRKDNGAPSLSMEIGNRRVSNQGLRLLRTAITARQLVRFDYIDAKNERTNRRVEPVSLLYKNHTWYLYGYCRTREDYREFKLSRMMELASLPEVFQRAHDAAPSNNAYEWMERHRRAEVVLNVSANSLAKAMDAFYDATRNFNEDGSLTLILKIDDIAASDWLISILLSFGEGVEIVEPRELRRQFKAKLEKMIGRYSES
ncbi:helix-turn-helix transcriptional regulator [Cohnella faecalis]|uniref:YafY family transcriptional regulator n=1 Tax=Cohnella faecalis TaxID=2315694 RepID=A0A398CIW3_9BACL|nr:YafY family protein [Cohnella faecalis]RIE01139.1 YafY family transcriptional regulator [Cohnella faecalis]